MHIEIVMRSVESYEVRVVDDAGRTIRTFTYPMIESARTAARVWTVAYGDCPTDVKRA